MITINIGESYCVVNVPRKDVMTVIIKVDDQGQCSVITKKRHDGDDDIPHIIPPKPAQVINTSDKA